MLNELHKHIQQKITRMNTVVGLAQYRASEPLQCGRLYAAPSGLSVRQAGLREGVDPGGRSGEHCRPKHVVQQESQRAQ